MGGAFVIGRGHLSPGTDTAASVTVAPPVGTKHILNGCAMLAMHLNSHILYKYYQSINIYLFGDLVFIHNSWEEGVVSRTS